MPFVPRLVHQIENALERSRRLAPESPYLLICEATKRPWKADHFRHAFAEIRAAAAVTCPSVRSAWFMDPRDTAVTQLALAGSTIPEIAALTGHSEGSAHQVLRHYLALNSEMAESAIAKLVAYEQRKREEG